MDPDPATTTVPLFALKITQFAGGGTAIGILAQHGVYDAEALVLFMKHWGQTHRGAPLDPAPDHNRLNEAAFRLASSSTAPGLTPRMSDHRGFEVFSNIVPSEFIELWSPTWQSIGPCRL